ncbi:MAG: hypothetical protein ACXAB7_22180, partial [Candidatus Kariarchaeaceae archaeon]
STETRETVTETLTYIDWDNSNEDGVNKIKELREYRDVYKGRDGWMSQYFDDKISHRITTENNKVYDVAVPLFLLRPNEVIGETGVDDFTWGSDNAPLKFESLTTITPDEEGRLSAEFDNYYYRNIKIRLMDRLDLFHDYLKQDPNEGHYSDYDGTIFEVEGAFITPKTKKVWYSSDMEMFIEKEKQLGHYLFFDSDYDSYHETIFILDYHPDSNGIYNVRSIAYNYDGKDFDLKPYQYANAERTKRIFRDISGRPIPGPKEGDSATYRDVVHQFLDVMYPTDVTGNLITQDSIFEIWKLLPDSGQGSSLYSETKSKEYANAWSIYEEQVAESVASQVFTIVVSGILAGLASATGFGTAFSGLVFATSYYLLNLFSSSVNGRMKLMKQQVKSRTFSPIGYEGDGPTSINKKLGSDHSDIWEHWFEHPSAKYITVSGGSPGDSYTAEVVAVAPVETRGPSYTLALDYFFATNGLLVLNDQNHYMVSADDGYEWGSPNFVNWKYRSNSIGGIEYLINEASNGDLDRIKPISINGRPAYIFAKDNYVIPPTSYNRPIAVNNLRFAEIGPNYHTISIDVKLKHASTGAKTRGINAYNLDPSEEGVYKAKIELTTALENYPIEQVSIQVLVPTSNWKNMPAEVRKYFNSCPEEVAFRRIHEHDISPGFDVGIDVDNYDSFEDLYEVTRDIVIDSSKYIIRDGNLYFTEEIPILANFEDVDYMNGDSHWNSVKKCFYRINIKVPTVVQYDVPSSNDPITVPGPDGPIVITPNPGEYTNGPGFGQPPGFAPSPSAGTEDFPIDASNQMGRTALHQAVSFMTTDYVNNFIMGASEGYAQAEIKFIFQTTLWSSIISSIILTPITLGFSSLASAASSGAQQITTKMVVKQIIAAVASSGSEVLEELYVDPAIERIILSFGLDQIWSDLVQSFREAVLGIGTQSYALLSDLQLDYQQNFQYYTQLQQYATDIATNQDLNSDSLLPNLNGGFLQSLQNSLTNMFDVSGMVNLALSIPSFFFGGFGLSMLSFALDIGLDIAFDEDRAKVDL